MMFVIMAYDVGEKRNAKVRKLAEKYLFPVQESVFQGDLSSKKLRKFQQEIKGVIDVETDKVLFYKTQNNYDLQIEEIGFVDNEEMIL